MKLTPQEIETRVRRVVNDIKSYHPLRVILFGSGARLEMDEYSDLDFVVIKATDRPLLDRMKEVALLCHVPGAIDFFVYTPQEWQALQEQESPFAQHVLEQGRVVYEAQP